MFQTVAVPQSRSSAGVQLALYGPFANSWGGGGLQPLLVRKVRQPQLLHAFFLYPKSKFPQLFGMFSHQEVGVLLSQRLAYWCVCSGCPSDHKCVQFVFKTSLYHYINIQSCHFMQQYISPAISGMFQTVAIPQSQLRCPFVTGFCFMHTPLSNWPPLSTSAAGGWYNPAACAAGKIFDGRTSEMARELIVLLYWQWRCTTQSMAQHHPIEKLVARSPVPACSRSGRHLQVLMDVYLH
jgi:hypothetical protein